MRIPVGRRELSTGAIGGRARGEAASRWWRGAAAVAAGALPALAFPGAVAVVVRLCGAGAVAAAGAVRAAPGAGRRSTGWLGGIGFMLAVHHWLLPSLHVFMLLLAALLGLLWAPWGVAGAAAARRAAVAGRAAAALRAGPVGLADDRTGPVLGGLGRPLGSARGEPVAGLAGAAAGVGGRRVAGEPAGGGGEHGGRRCWSRCRGPGRAGGWRGGVVLRAGHGARSWVWAPQPEQSGRPGSPSCSRGSSTASDSVERRFDRSEELTRQLAGQDVDLVVWGESSVGDDLRAAARSARPGSRRSRARSARRCW